VSEVVSVSGAVSVPHEGLKRGDRVRIVIDGHVDGYGEKDTKHKGTEYKFNISADTGFLLQGDEFQRYDDRVAELKAAKGASDERQGGLLDDEAGGHDLPVGADNDGEPAPAAGGSAE
jgi:hypothetical protein